MAHPIDPATTAGMSDLLIQAAQSAAQADGLAAPPIASSSMDPFAAASSSSAPPTTSSSSPAANANAAALQQHHAKQQQQQQQQQQPPPVNSGKKGPALRRGKWTPEEEAYANRLIQEFKAGLLPLTDGTTLRTFLSKLLNCDPMRISKKFVGSNCIGKQVFRRRNADMNRLTPEQIQQSRAELSELERRFLERVAQTNRVKSSGVVASNGGAGGGGGGGGPTASSILVPSMMAGGGIGGGGGGVSLSGADMLGAAMGNAGGMHQHHDGLGGGHGGDPPSPPWLAPPLGYKPGSGAAFAAANLANSRAAAAGRALLGGGGGGGGGSGNGSGTMSPSSSFNAAAAAAAAAASSLPWRSSAGLLAMAELQQRASQQNLANALSGMAGTGGGNSQSNFFRSGSNSGFSSQALSQLQQTASAARLADFASNGSMNSLLLKTGLSRDQLSQLARDHQHHHQHHTNSGGGGAGTSSSSGGLMSSGSLSNMMNLHPNHRQNSFDALMSLNFQSLQSIDNLANLMQTTSGGGGVGSSSGSGLPETGLKNADFGAALAASASQVDHRDVGLGLSSNGAAGNGGGLGASRTGSTPDRGASNNNGAGAMGMGSAEDLSLAAVRRLASAGRMESLLKSFSSNNMRGVGGGDASTSNNNLSNFLQSLQANAGGGSGAGGGGAGNLSTASLLHAGGPSAVSLANLLRQDSSTGLTALRMQDGLNQRNSSVDDFLSLMMAGDIPHQDPSLLNVPLLHHQGPGAGAGGQQQQQQQQQQGQQQGQQDPARLLAQSQMLQQMQDAITSDRSFANLAGLNSPAAASQLNLLAQAQQQQKRKLEELEAALTAQAVQQQHQQQHQQHQQQHEQQQASQHSAAAAASSPSSAPHSVSSGGPGAGTGSDNALAASLVGSSDGGPPSAKRAHLQ